MVLRNQHKYDESVDAEHFLFTWRSSRINEGLAWLKTLKKRSRAQYLFVPSRE